MPLVVDHEARRRQVARISAGLIAERGLEGASVREIARAAGCSTAVVSHYFADKRELLLATYREALADTVANARRRAARGESLMRCLEAIMPLDRARRDRWKVWFALWGTAMADPAFIAEQRQRGREARALFAELIGVTIGAPGDAAARDAQARQLLVMVSGLATQATYDPGDWPPARQRAIVAAEIEALHLDAGRGVAQASALGTWMAS